MAVKAAAPVDETLVPPETVRVQKVVFDNQLKRVTVSNNEGRYVLACNANQDNCVTPTPGKDYLLINKTTKWKLPGATGYLTLKFLEDFSITYNNEENIALLAAEGDSTIGMYRLISWSKTDAEMN
ncbi:MAG: hypothetical protein NVS1B11_20700 [Terriglobales bacterium]